MPEEHVSDIERHLAALLAVDPSPAFAAGVRGRLASRPVARGWTLWMLAAAAAVLVVAGGLMTRSLTRVPLTTPSALDTAQRETPAPSSPREQPKPLRADVQPQRRKAIAVHIAAGPEVIVDPALQRTVRQLAHAARYPEASYAVAIGPADTAPAAELEVTPMTVGALAVAEITVSDPQSGARR